MITCKICESNIQTEKLKDHSSKCKEVTELKENLIEIRIKMENYAEKASKMKNCLETYAAKQKKSHKKFFRSGSLNLSETDFLQTPKAISRSDSINKDNDFASAAAQGTEDSLEKTMERTPKSGDFSEFYEPAKKMTDEEYEVFIFEAKKGVFALKKIIAYANKIHAGICENDLDFDVKNELEGLYAEIIDAKMGEFLKNFMLDLADYINIKAKHAKGSEKLAEINGEDHSKNIKQPFPFKKSHSFKEKRSLKFKVPRKASDNYKEDGIYSTSGSPNRGKKFLVPQPVPESKEKSNLLKSSEDSTGSTPTLKSLNFSGFAGIFQNNSNHVAQRSLFCTSRINSSGLDAFREKISSAIAQKNKENFLNKESEYQQLKTPTEMPRNQNSIWKPTNIKTCMSGRNSDKRGPRPINEQSRTPMINTVLARQSARKAPKSQMRRTSSMELYNTLFKEEISAQRGFPSLLTRNASNIADAFFVEEKASPCKLKPAKKQSSDDSPMYYESPGIKGYYSDTCIKPRKKVSWTSESAQVTIDDFEPIKYIGQGAYGTVWLVRKKATGDEYAMKIVDWGDRAAQNRLSALKKEKDIYHMLTGDSVVKAVWTFHYENFICFVTEFMIGGDFNNILDHLGRLDEEQARFYFAELVVAVESLHSLGIVHRDLKPENILMDARGHIRLTDFGLSRAGLDKFRENAATETKGKGTISPTQIPATCDYAKTAAFFDRWNKGIGRGKDHIEFKTKKNKEMIFGFLKEEILGQSPSEGGKKGLTNKRLSMIDTPVKKKAMVGTPDYMAPEVIDCEKMCEKYDEKCMDWWSMGVILYQLLVGIPPFCDNTIESVFDNIRNYRIEWPAIGHEEDCITPEAVDLIKRLLEPNPNKRFGTNGAQEIKNHPFFKGFDWEGLREREAPIIPFEIQDQEVNEAESLKDLEEKKPKVEFPRSVRVGPMKRELKQIDLSGFQMRRLDVLDRLNQETYMKLKTLDNSKEKSDSAEVNQSSESQSRGAV